MKAFNYKTNSLLYQSKKANRAASRSNLLEIRDEEDEKKTTFII